MKDPKYISKVKILLLQELEEGQNNQNFFKLLQIRTTLINDLILIKDKKKAQSQLIKMKDMYYKLKSLKIETEDMDNFIHQYILSNLQIENYQEALIFTQKLNSNLETLKKEIEIDKKKQKDLINKYVTISNYLWTIYRQGEQNYQKSMEIIHNISKMVEKLDSKLFDILKPQVLNQFDQMMIDVIVYNIEKKEFEKCLKLYNFYVQNCYRDLITQKQEHRKINSILESIASYYSYIDLSTQKFSRLNKIDKMDEDIFTHSVEQYYQLSIVLNEDMGVDIRSFQIDIDPVFKKLSGSNQRRVFSSQVNFEKAVERQRISDLEDRLKEMKEENQQKQEKQNVENQQHQQGADQETKENVVNNPKLKL